MIKPGSRWQIKDNPTIKVEVLYADDVTVLFHRKEVHDRGTHGPDWFLEHYEPAPAPPTKHRVWINLFSNGGAGYPHESEQIAFDEIEVDQGNIFGEGTHVETRCIEWEAPHVPETR